MKGFISALQFLTVIPLSTKADDKSMKIAVVYFPLIGFLIGLLAILVMRVSAAIGLNELAANIFVIIFLVIMTGGLHLDGLADTFDALASGKSKDEMLKIMRDPHIGSVGVLTLILALLSMVALLSCMSGREKAVNIILMCVLSRWAMVMVMSCFQYARNEGKARIFIEGINLTMLAIATLMTLTVVFAAAGLKGIMVFLFTGLLSCLFARHVDGKIGGITGDTLGAVNELAQICTLFSACIFKGIII